MTNYKNAKKALTIGASLSLAVTLAFSTAAVSVAADAPSASSTVYTGIPSGLNAADKAAFEAQDKWKGELHFSVSDADLANMKAIGFDPKLTESASITNWFNDSDYAKRWDKVGAGVFLAPDIDAAKAKANSPYASLIDTDTPIVNADGIPATVGFSLRDDNFFDLNNNITTKQFQTKPSLEAGQFTSGGGGQYGKTTTTSTFKYYETDGTEHDLGAYFGNIYAYPSTDNTQGGLPGDKKDNLGYGITSGGSVFLETDYIDDRLPSEKRTEDVSLDGTQRTQDVSTRTDIVTNAGEMGFWIQPMASGKLTDGSEFIGSIALMDPVWVTVTSTRQKELPTYTEASPLVTTTTDGAKVNVWYEPSKGDATYNASWLLAHTGYDFFDASIPLVPTDKAIYDEFHGNTFAGEFNYAQLIENYEAPGSFILETSYSSSYFSATEKLTSVANDVSAEEAKVATRQANFDRDKIALDVANANVVTAEAALAQGISDGATGSALFKLNGDASEARMAQNEAQGNYNDSEARLASAQTALATAKAKPATNYKLTYTKTSLNSGSDTPSVWGQSGAAMAVGQTWTSTFNQYDATFTVESNANSVLVIDVKVDEAPTVAARVQSAGTPSIGIGQFIMGSGEAVRAPGYTAKYVIVETPTDIPTDTPTPSETPTPTTSETPTPTPSETPTTPVVVPDDSSTDQTVIPDDAATDGFMPDDLGETAATLADTGANGNIALWTLAGGFGILAGLLASFAGWIGLKNRRLAKADQ